jgi:PAS domain S-box-containing protein
MANDVTLGAEQFRLLYDNAPIGIAVTRGYTFLYMNQAFAQLYGYDTPEEIKETSLLDFIVSTSQYKVMHRVRRRALGETVTGTIEVQCKRKDGSCFTARADVGQLALPDGPVAIAFVTDITAQKEAERQREDFLSLVSHELRTPLTTVKAYTQMLQKKFEREQQQDVMLYLGKMDIQINKIIDLVLMVLDTSMMQTDQYILEPELFEVDELIRDTVALAQQTTSKHTIRIQGHTACGLYGDVNRLGQALKQLLLNAIKFSPIAGMIIVKSQIDQDSLVISVQDFGIGIAQHHQQRIFERFYRAYEEKCATYPGLGIGLYLVQQVITRHGGRVWVESKEGQGATFSFSLPLHEHRAEQHQEQKQENHSA